LHQLSQALVQVPVQLASVTVAQQITRRRQHAAVVIHLHNKYRQPAGELQHSSAKGGWEGGRVGGGGGRGVSQHSRLPAVDSMRHLSGTCTSRTHAHARAHARTHARVVLACVRAASAQLRRRSAVTGTCVSQRSAPVGVCAGGGDGGRWSARKVLDCLTARSAPGFSAPAR
jgi:hypothetical protein